MSTGIMNLYIHVFKNFQMQCQFVIESEIKNIDHEYASVGLILQIPPTSVINSN